MREFVVGMEVVPEGPLDGKAVGEGNLRNLQGVFLVEIERDGEVIAPVAPETVLHGGDRLTFVGRADTVVDLQAMRGLGSREREHVREFDTHRHTFFEAVIGAASPLVGKTLKDVGFRGRYQAAVVAIHRAGQRVEAKLGSVRLKAGDTLLLLSDPGFRDRWRDRTPFLLVSRLGGAPPAVSRKAWLVGLILAAVVGSAGLGVMPILNAALLAVFALVLLGILTPGEARNAVDLDVILVIAGAFGLAAALEGSGLAERGAGLLVGAFGGPGCDGWAVGDSARHGRPGVHHHQQCGGRADVPDRPLDGRPVGRRSQAICDRGGRCGLGVVSDPDRLSRPTSWCTVRAGIGSAIMHGSGRCSSCWWSWRRCW